MIQDIHKDAADKMQKSLASLDGELSKLRAGRAHPDLLSQIKASCYGQEMPLAQVASVTVEGSRTLVVTPWAKDTVNAISKAIMTSDLGLNPSVNGEVIRVTLPALTEERRQEMVKIVRSTIENARVAIRNIRRDANGRFKALVKDKEISEDEARVAESNIQTLTNETIATADQQGEKKEKDLLEL